MSAQRLITKEAFFLDTPSGPRFAIATRPSGKIAGGWIYVHPFAEEMNKSRRMAALGANELARRGWLVLQVDLYGCGDSAGDFGDAHWQDWLDDLTFAWEWMSGKCDGAVGIWALRCGSLLASDWVNGHSERPPLLFWQPIRNGQQHLVQFLRLKAANEMLSNSAKGVVSSLREQLGAGTSVEIAGYSLSSKLAAGLESSRLRLPDGYPGPVKIIEVVQGDRREPTPGASALVNELQKSGVDVELATANGPSFWQTLEIEQAPALIDATARIVRADTHELR